MFQSGILEVAMLLCFAAAWPVSIRKSLRSRTARGKSLGFMLILELGYVFGILNKYFTDSMNYVVIFYVINICLVATDVILYFRNRRLDMIKELEGTNRIRRV